MSGPVTYRHDENIGVITLDDGKANVLGPDMQQAINDAIDQADRDDVGALVIAGNEKVFSGGFDLKVFRSGDIDASVAMLRGGFELSYRLLSYPKPVVMACTGHAIAMGSFLLCSGDHRITAPAYNIQANEVAIGMVMPYAALEVVEAAADPFGLPAGRRAGQRLLRRVGQSGRLGRRSGAGRQGAGAGRGGRAGVREPEPGRARRQQAARPRRGTARHPRRDRQHGSRVRHLARSRAQGKTANPRTGRPRAGSRGRGAQRGRRLGVHHSPGGRARADVSARGVRIVHRQGRFGACGVLRRFPAAGPRTGRRAGDGRPAGGPRTADPGVPPVLSGLPGAGAGDVLPAVSGLRCRVRRNSRRRPCGSC